MIPMMPSTPHHARSSGRHDLGPRRALPHGGWTGEEIFVAAPGFGQQAGAGDAPQSLFALVDDRLRGRWLVMLAIGSALAIVLGAIGFLSTRPLYESQGAIRVAPYLPAVLEKIPETAEMPYYQQFVATQVQYIQSRRVLENAMEIDALKSLPWAKRVNLLAALEEGLDAQSDRRSELILVSFRAEEQKVAQTVCDAIVRSYDEIHGRAGGNTTSDTLARLGDLRDQLGRDLKTKRAETQAILARHRTTDLDELHAARSRELEEMEQRIAMAELVLGRIESRGIDFSPAPDESGGPTLRELELIDPRLVELRRLRDRATTEFERMRRKYRPGSAMYARFEQEATTAQQLFDGAYEVALGEWQTHGLEALPAEGLEGFFERLPVSRLREELETLRAKASASAAEGGQLLADIQRMGDLEFESESMETELDRVHARIDSLEREGGAISSRISVVQPATWPHSPAGDGRARRALAGLALGFGLSFGAFFVIGSFDRRTYGAVQLQSRVPGKGTELLGVLPDLARLASDPESNDVASHCVHQIRNQIDLRRDLRSSFVLCVSSPFQGDGKTSIVMALGWSYAAAGYNTLLVDGDLVGRSLTRQLGLIGRIGLREALLARDPEGAIEALPVAHLSAMASGATANFGPERVRRIDLEALLGALRDRYDLVIVDTGPLLGSLESTPVTASADGVVLSLRRGRSRTRLEECVRRLEASGACCLGVVLNCVDRSECNRYVSEASLSAAEAERRGAAFRAAGGGAGSAVRAPRGERNALIAAMESTSRERVREESGDSSAEVRAA